MTSRRAYWCPKTMKQRPCSYPKPVLWEFNSFLMQTLSFVPINLHRCWPREWKHSIAKALTLNFSIFERFKIKGRQNDECLSMYPINTIPHGKCFVRYLPTRCFCIRNRTSERNERVRFLIQKQFVCKYRTPALSMKYSLFLDLFLYLIRISKVTWPLSLRFKARK